MKSPVISRKRLAVCAAVLAAVVVPACAADAVPVAPAVVVEESQWEKFKAGARTAGQAVAQGTRNTAGKVAEGAREAGAVAKEKSRHAGKAIAESYEDAKEYVHEKLDD